MRDSPHRRASLSLYLPAILMGIPGQALFVLLPLYVIDIGGTPAAAAAVIGWRGFGMLIMGLPAGWMASYLGYRSTMLIASATILLAFLLYGLSANLLTLYGIAFLHGCGSSTFLLGRMTCITSVFEANERGRVISVVAGGLRLSTLLGPLLGGILVNRFDFSLAFSASAGMMALGLLFTYIYTQERRTISTVLRVSAVPEFIGVHKSIFYTAGSAAVAFMFLRAARNILIPLVGVHLSLDATTIGFIVSMSALVDLLLVYPTGVMMDRWGRRITAMPSAILFATSLGLIAFSNSYEILLLFAILAGVANGLSTGIVMTLGADNAPENGRGEFLGFWRVLTDLGNVSGPMLISGILFIGSLQFASIVVGLIGLSGSIFVHRAVCTEPEKDI
jgi:MFS family permease